MRLPLQNDLRLPTTLPAEWNLQIEYLRAAAGGTLLCFENAGTSVLTIAQDSVEIRVELRFDAKDTPILLVAPLPAATDVSLLISNSRSRVALYLDGQLCDEDWTLGSVALENSLCTVCAAQATLHDDFSVEQGYLQVYSPPLVTNIQNWKPDGFNTGVGDCMPFSHAGVFHLFYLFDRRSHASKWGLGAHQWAHLSTTDLRTWQQHPLAIAIDEQYEGSICTGSLIFHDGTYYAYNAVRMSDGSPAKLSWSVSSDGVHFRKTGQFFTLSAPYEPVSARDPFVFRDETGTFHLLVTTSLLDTQGNNPRGCLAHLTSPDLRTWQQEPPMLMFDNAEQPECSDYFAYNGWYYLIFSQYGTAHYRMSRLPFGPWVQPENDILGYKECRVPKTALFQNRILVAGFVVFPKPGYAGEVILYEALQNDDGTLSFIKPEELPAPQTILT